MDLTCPLIATPKNRQRAHRFLRQVTGGTNAEASAAGISAMIAGYGPDRAAALTAQTFRVLPFRNMRHSDFLNGDLGSRDDELRSRTQPCQLGDADAFMSHSWRDDAAAKWHTLATWQRTWSAAHAAKRPAQDEATLGPTGNPCMSEV